MPELKFTCTVYDHEGDLVAYCNLPEAAAGIISSIGFNDWMIKWRKAILWLEGAEEITASESVLTCAEIVLKRWESAKADTASKKQERLGK